MLPAEVPLRLAVFAVFAVFVATGLADLLTLLFSSTFVSGPCDEHCMVLACGLHSMVAILSSSVG
jgi:hypothetical protein